MPILLTTDAVVGVNVDVANAVILGEAFRFTEAPKDVEFATESEVLEPLETFRLFVVPFSAEEAVTPPNSMVICAEAKSHGIATIEASVANVNKSFLLGFLILFIASIP